MSSQRVAGQHRLKTEFIREADEKKEMKKVWFSFQQCRSLHRDSPILTCVIHGWVLHVLLDDWNLIPAGIVPPRQGRVNAERVVRRVPIRFDRLYPILMKRRIRIEPVPTTEVNLVCEVNHVLRIRHPAGREVELARRCIIARPRQVVGIVRNHRVRPVVPGEIRVALQIVIALTAVVLDQIRSIVLIDLGIKEIGIKMASCAAAAAAADTRIAVRQPTRAVGGTVAGAVAPVSVLELYRAVVSEDGRPPWQ